MEIPFMSEKGLLKIAKILDFSEEQKLELEKRISAISSNSVLEADKDISFKWSHIARDYNKIHLFDSNAQEAGFQKTLDHGTHIASHKEQYILDILRIINSVNKIEDMPKKEIFYINESIQFQRPLYHGTKTNWHCNDVTEIGNDIGLEFSAVNEAGKTLIPKSVSRLGLERRVFTAQDMDSFSGKSVIASGKDKINYDELKIYYECLGRLPQGIVPMMLPAVFPIALLLGIYSKEEGKQEGIYKSMNLEFHNLPNVEGEFLTKIIMTSSPKKERRYYEYTFRTLCTQEKTPILSGEIVCRLKKEINLI